MGWVGRKAQRGGRVASVNRTGVSWLASGVALVLGCCLMACDGAEPTPAPAGDDAGSSGHDGGLPDRETGPECGADPVPFVPVLVQAREEFIDRWNSEAPMRVRLVERGAGLPPGGTHGSFYPYRD